MDIEQLLSQPESKTLEFKRDLSSLTPILKTVIAFANTAGGILIIGRSNEGELLGLEDVLKAEEAIANTIADNIRPAILPDIEIITIKGKDLLVIRVSHWRAPFYLKKEGIPKGVYVRLGSTSRLAGPELLAELQRSVLSLSFDQQPLPELSKEDLQPELVEQFFKGVKRGESEEKLRSLGVLTLSGHRVVPSLGGLILFGKKSRRNRFFPDARVGCARFLGDDKTQILDRYEVEGSLLEAVTEVPKFIARNTRLAAEIQAMRRKDIPEYPLVAIRESLINALVHADYSITGSHIQIAIFDNRLEIQNPGMLPFGFTMEDFKAGVSRIRNRVIARTFHELELMEEWGSGYRRILQACRVGGYPEPKWEELGTMIRVTFFPHSQALLDGKKGRHLSTGEESKEIEKAILSLFKKGEALPFRDIFKKIKIATSQRTLRYSLAHLKQKGVLISKGKGRATIWQKAP